MVQQVLYNVATGALIQWQDTEAFGYPAAPAGTATLPVTAAEWATQATAQHVAAGALAAGSAPLTLAQQAQAAIGGGLAIACTGTPSLDATYPTDGLIWSDLKDEASFIASFGGFSTGTSSMTFVLPLGATVTFTATAQLQAVVKQIGMYLSALKTIVAQNAGTLPPNPVTIA